MYNVCIYTPIPGQPYGEIQPLSPVELPSPIPPKYKKPWYVLVGGMVRVMVGGMAIGFLLTGEKKTDI